MSDPDSPIREVRWQGQDVVLAVSGDVDLTTSKPFQDAALAVLARKPRHVVVNLAGVPYMDSSGIASLVKLLSRARKQGTAVSLAALNDRTRSLLEITRLDTVFRIFATEEEALAQP
jgi:anti-sigma B factor antagonist